MILSLTGGIEFFFGISVFKWWLTYDELLDGFCEIVALLFYYLVLGVFGYLANLLSKFWVSCKDFEGAVFVIGFFYYNDCCYY